MQPDRRAVIFDLDDTLYPYAWFRASGFAAIASYLEQMHECDGRDVLRTLLQCARGERRGREIQTCLEEQRLPSTLLPVLVDVFRTHPPELNLPGPARGALRALRQSGWLTGILTNGHPAVQRSKIAALGLADAVDTIVCAAEVGASTGKPDPEAFLTIARCLDVSPARVVVVGNDEQCDIAGAAAAGMRTVLCTAWADRPAETAAERVAERLGDVPGIAEALLEGATKSHAA